MCAQGASSGWRGLLRMYANRREEIDLRRLRVTSSLR
jgi:hypothetical protein